MNPVHLSPLLIAFGNAYAPWQRLKLASNWLPSPAYASDNDKSMTSEYLELTYATSAMQTSCPSHTVFIQVMRHTVFLWLTNCLTSQNFKFYHFSFVVDTMLHEWTRAYGPRMALAEDLTWHLQMRWCMKVITNVTPPPSLPSKKTGGISMKSELGHWN